MKIAFISSFTIREHNLEELRMCINSFKKYNSIKVDWYITTDLPDLAHYFFKDFKSNTINLIFRGFKPHNNFYFDRLSNQHIDNNELEITCDNKLTYWQYFSGCSNKTLTAIDICDNYDIIAYIDTDLIFYHNIYTYILAFFRSSNDVFALQGNLRHIDENNNFHKIIAPNAGFCWIKCTEENKHKLKNYETYLSNIPNNYYNYKTMCFDEISILEMNFNIMYATNNIISHFENIKIDLAKFPCCFHYRISMLKMLKYTDFKFYNELLIQIFLIYQSSKEYNEPKILNYILTCTKYIIENYGKEIQYLKDFIKLEQCKQFWDKQLGL